MNKISKKRSIWGLLICSVLISFSCKKCCPDTNKGFGFKQLVKAPHAIALIDIGAMKNIEKATVIIGDPNGMVVSSNGYKLDTLELIGGVMSLGLSQDAHLGPDSVYRYFIEVIADGYVPTMKTVIITTDKPNYFPIYLTSANRSMTGAAVLQQESQLNTKGAIQSAQTIRLNLESLGELSIKVPQDAYPLYDGKPVNSRSNKLTYNLILGNPNDSIGSRLFPSGFEVTDARDRDGRPYRFKEIPVSPANSMIFTSLGYFTLDMRLGNNPVNGFSTPVDIEMPILPGVKDPMTNEKIKEGSIIPIWSLDYRSGVWQQEQEATVVNAGNGKLKVNFKTSHFSTWNMDLPGARCGSTISLTFDPAQFNGQLFTRLLNRTNGAELSSELVDFDADASNQFRLKRFPSTSDAMQLVVHTGADYTFPLLGVSNDITSCACAAPCSLNVVGTPGTCVILKFQVGPDNINPCNNAVWYKDPANNALFTLGGVLNASGEVIIPSLTLNKPVRLWYYDSNAGQQVTLDFMVNFNATGHNEDAPLTITQGANPAQSDLFDFDVDAMGSCGKRITIFIPNNIITNLTGCM